MSPVFSKNRHDLSHDIRSCDCPINVRYHNFVIILPHEYSAFYVLVALKSRGNTEYNFIDSIMKSELLQLV